MVIINICLLCALLSSCFNIQGFFETRDVLFYIYYLAEKCDELSFRPMEMTTEDFGKLWLSLSNDVKQNIKMSSCQDSLSAALDTLQQKLKLHRVDIIGE